MKRYIVTVMVERMYEQVIEAASQEEAEAKAATLNIQDDEDLWSGTEVGDPIVEPLVDEVINEGPKKKK